MLAPLKNMAGQQVGEVELNDQVFAAPVNAALMHQALVRQMANARLGTHKTKTRGEVEGGGKKPWRQKGTGRARQGSTRAPNFIGGGKVFGPTPRKYTQALPKKMQRSALRSALSAKAGDGQIVVLDNVTVNEYRTKTIAAMLTSLGIAERKVLMVLQEKSDQVWRSSRNVAQLTTILSNYINVRDLLGHDVVLISNDAVKHIENWLGEANASEETASETVA
jgi:large subunit ribosomal protein L4